MDTTDRGVECGNKNQTSPTGHKDHRECLECLVTACGKRDFCVKPVWAQAQGRIVPCAGTPPVLGAL